MFGKEHFRLKQEHILLLRGSSVRWDDCEFGAAAIDSKRPYGNSGSQIYRDIAKLIGMELPDEDENYGELPEDVQDKLHELHLETENALQVILDTGAMIPGQYEREKYVGRWEKVAD